MEQVFREKVNSLNTNDQMKKPILFKKRGISQKGVTSSYKYNFVKEIEKMSINRPGTFRKKPKKTVKKYSLTPISNKTLPLNYANAERSAGFHNENELEYRIKVRNSNTPINSVRNRYVSETYKTPQKNKLSLVQSVIKIQRWFRREKKIFNIELKSDYIVMGFKFFVGVKYFMSVFKELNYKTKIQGSNFIIEAWPLVSHILKPLNVKTDLNALCDLLEIPCDEAALRDKDNVLLNCLYLNQSKIVLRKIEFIYSGENNISGNLFQILIFLHDRVLEIEAANENSKFCTSIKLDPLQDLNHIHSKVSFILDNLSIKSGNLVLDII